MSTGKPLLVVLGATGKQGGSVLRHFLSLSPSPYALRGITRDPTSIKSASLASLGVEVVAGDFDDPTSLDAAFKGASVIFSVTDFWQAYAKPALHEKASASGQSIMLLCRDAEAQQNKNIVDAAAKVSTLERFIFSSLPNCDKLSKGKYFNVYHFDGKAIAEEYGRAIYPELFEKTNVLYAGYYLENYFSPAGGLVRPKLNKDKDTLVLAASEPTATAPFPMYSAIDDTGALVHALLRAPPSKKVIGVNEWLSFRDFAKILAQVLGKGIEFVDGDIVFDLGDPEINKDHEAMKWFCIEFGYDGGKVDKSVVQPSDLEVPAQLASVREWCQKQDWERVLEVIE